MITVKGMTGMQVNEGMAKYKVYIGRVWPVWPEKVRVTVGTMDEMKKFNDALDKALNS
jgi:histidinol-phosphate/aromatic aminotransferase/cobyric acid decarboxylase-like protein